MKKLCILILFSYNYIIFSSDEMISQEIINETLHERLNKKVNDPRISPNEIANSICDQAFIETDKEIMQRFHNQVVDQILYRINHSIFKFNNIAKEKHFLQTAYILLTRKEKSWIHLFYKSKHKAYDPNEFIKMLSPKKQKKLQKLYHPKVQEQLFTQLTYEQKSYFNTLLCLIPKE